MSTNFRSESPKNAAHPAFSQRFTKLQEDLKATLRQVNAKPEVVLATQDMLIARVEGWVDSVEDLQVLTRTDIDLLRQALAANRRVYRIKALAVHDVEISICERSALDNLLSTTIRTLSTVHALGESKADVTSPSPEDASAPAQSHYLYH